MFFVYNFLQFVAIVIGLPFITLLVLCKKKYRGRILYRLGFGLREKLSRYDTSGKKVIWIHSLSVGEVTSALPLVRGIKKEMDNTHLIFSTTTQSGMKVAEDIIQPYVDVIIPAPLDILPAIRTFIRYIQPNLFILVETDFWPNWLRQLQHEKVPALLVNGRISQSSFTTYQRFQPFFLPLFQTFSLLSMQTETDSLQMQKLGISQTKIKTLGNLKYAQEAVDIDEAKVVRKNDLNIAEKKTVWICGSTHRGEEEILLEVYSQLKTEHKNLALIIAPRDPGRAGEIQSIARRKSLHTVCRTVAGDPVESVLILDTIGELARCYRLAEIAFIGGSLVDSGGHNPLEAAACEVPVLFGPHMEDFQEIARDLVQAGGGKIIQNSDELADTVHQLLSEPEMHSTMGKAAGSFVVGKSGVVQNHLEVIRPLLI